MFFRFVIKHACDRRTYGQTDRIKIPKTALVFDFDLIWYLMTHVTNVHVTVEMYSACSAASRGKKYSLSTIDIPYTIRNTVLKKYVY